MLHSTGDAAGPLTAYRRSKTRNGKNRVELSNALEILTPMVNPPDESAAAALNLTVFGFHLNWHFYQ
jgi:hypothetical protein